MRSLFCILILVPSLASGAEDFPGIRAMMTAEEFEQAGLHKQSPAELKALNQWLIRYTANEAPMVRKAVEEVKKEADKAIHSAIAGEFTGWRGDTLFRLNNGQVWRQRLSGRWRVKLQDPEVVISRNFFGYYDMEVVESGKKIGVKRVK